MWSLMSSDVGLRVDILGTKCDQCVSMVQCCFTSTEAVRLVRTGSPGQPLRLSYSSRILCDTHKALCSTHKALCGTHKALCGTYKALCGTHKALCGTHKALCFLSCHSHVYL